MNPSKLRLFAVSVSLSALVGPAVAAQPPDNVVSDGGFNTAMGTGALQNMQQGAKNNTAAGFGALGADTTGFGNSALGDRALGANTTGKVNTAVGAAALFVNTTGQANTAVGSGALGNNVSGSNNDAFGYGALGGSASGVSNTALGGAALSNNSGSYNVAVGQYSLTGNGAGSDNTAVGYAAMQFSAGGSNNTAVGYEALQENSGSLNTALGHFAARNNNGGSYNTVSGFRAMYSNQTGSYNSLLGTDSAYSNVTGSNNTALGWKALYANSSGAANIAIGNMAGYAVTGSDNIDIGAQGQANENGVIRVGTAGTQNTVYVAGIRSTMITGGSPVYVDANGKLGLGGASSERFKAAISPMGTKTDQLESLSPVTYRYKEDPSGALHYGLIAEQVAQIYPELVLRDANGVIQGVRYEELAPMLLNRLQSEIKQQRAMQQQIDELRRELRQVAQAVQSGNGHASQVAMR